MSNWPTIEEPSADPSKQIGILQAMKQTLEMLTGQRKAPIATARAYVEPIAPGAVNSPIPVQQLRKGDFWINTASSNKLNFWNDDLKSWRPTS